MLEKMFKLSENHTTIKTEIVAGITTFMTMAYILAVNPNLLSNEFGSNMDATAVLIATCLASFVGTLAMALLANYPFALAPNGIKCVFFIYCLRRYGIFLAGRFDGGICGRPDIHCIIFDKCQRGNF